MQAEVIVFTSPKYLDAHSLDLAGFCKQSLNFSFAQPFTGDKPSKAASAYQSLMAMQPA